MATSDEVVEAISEAERTKLRWAHERLTSMGYEPEDEDEQQHPAVWWDENPQAWASALAAQAALLSASWDEHAGALEDIAWTLEHAGLSPRDRELAELRRLSGSDESVSW